MLDFSYDDYFSDEEIEIISESDHVNVTYRNDRFFIDRDDDSDSEYNTASSLLYEDRDMQDIDSLVKSREIFDATLSYYDSEAQFEDYLIFSNEFPVMKEVLKVLYFFWMRNDKLKSQNIDRTPFKFDLQSDSNGYLYKLNMCISSIVSRTDSAYVIKLVEDISLLSYHLIHGNNRLDYLVAIANFIKLRSGKAIISIENYDRISDHFSALFDNEVQTSDDNLFISLRSFLDKYETVKNLPIFKKLYKFLMYCLSLSLFEKAGVTFSTFRFSKIERESIKQKYHMGTDFIHCILDTIIFICERGYQCMVSGSLDPIFHSGNKYELWFIRANEMKIQSNYLTCPEPHGIDKFGYLADLNAHIEAGESIYRHAMEIGVTEKKMVGSLLNDLMMIKNNELTRRFAQQERKAPFGVLLFGGSSVAKSTFTKLLYYHYGKIFNLRTEAEFKYTRNPSDEYWVNFNSTQWCIQMDDIAFMNPNKAASGDPSIMEMLQVVNNVPFVPTQADLADKGKTPMNCRFVIATTNTKHLNAQAYFSCPLAVQRRLPWVIDIRPKDIYCKDGQMLDGDKVPILEEGEYPDYWDIVVYRVKPVGSSRENQKAGFEEYKIFDDIYQFIAWFSIVAKEFDVLQDKSLNCDNSMSRVTICSECYVPINKCICELQSGDVEYYIPPTENTDYHEDMDAFLRVSDFPGWRDIPELGFIYIFKFYFFCIFLYLFHRYNRLRIMYVFFFGNLINPSFIWQCSDPRFLRIFFRILGNVIERKYGRRNCLIFIVSSITACYTMYKSSSFVYRWLKTEKREDQGASASTGVTPAPMDKEREQVWFKNDFVLTSFDVSPMTTSYHALDKEHIMNIILNNCIQITSRTIEGLSRPNRAFCLGGHTYITNNHGIPENHSFILDVIQEPFSHGVNRNTSMMMSQTEIVRFPEKDLCIFRIRGLPPKKDLRDLFAKDTFSGVFKGMYLSRNPDGSYYKKNVDKIHFRSNILIKALDITTNMVYGRVQEPTKRGDCGTLLLADTGYGPVICGMHVVGDDDGVVGAIHITKSWIDEHYNVIDRLQIQSGVPSLSAPSAPRELVDLARKCPARFLEEGSCNVYGSFSGFRPSTKSCVKETIIKKSCMKRGYADAFGAPVMKGWKPWYLAFKEMATPAAGLRPDILAHCVDAFYKDIMKGLSVEELKEKLVIYDNMTAVNGAAGVTYVDKMNRNTSMGNPWKKGKKYFINPIDAVGQLQDPVEFNDEVMDRVDDCMEKYWSGVRYMPNYCAHLKDESLPYNKIRLEKTRLFTGAPADWTIVVRKYLLSFVKLFQDNRFLFEGAPGTVAQSTEWGDIYEYLTFHGKDRIVAGDYGKFDKKMHSSMILAAFDVIRKLQESAGWSDRDLLVTCGIAEDVAFPLIDFNGDLIEFYGSNPSGHPLTVIINCIANSLYMRYAFTVLNPLHECFTFKEYVNLMTYGDDNGMGVSRKCDWFNHTAIQEVLANIGVEYTMADKTSESKPFIHINDVSFLKRYWRYDVDVGAFLCPIEESSIGKMLTSITLSKTLCEEAQIIAIIGTAVREYFFYGREKFEEKVLMFKEIITENDLDHYVESWTFPTWDELKLQFWESSKML